jgi:hypothetical protein
MDALEGYILSNAGDPGPRIKAMMNNINPQMKDNNLRSIWQITYKWAALFILVGTVGALAHHYITSNSKTTPYATVGQKENTQPVLVESTTNEATSNKTSTESILPKNTSKSAGTIRDNDNSSTLNKATAEAQLQAIPTEQIDFMDNKPPRVEESDVLNKKDQSALDISTSQDYPDIGSAEMDYTQAQKKMFLADESVSKDSEMNRLKMFSAIVLSENGQPLAGALVRIGKDSLYTNDKGYLTTTTKNPVSYIEVKATGYITIREPIDDKQSFYTITLIKEP